MTNNLTVIQLFCFFFIVSPMFILWRNNRYLSARKTSSQMLLGATLMFALIAAESSNKFILAVSVTMFTLYLIRLVSYFVASLQCIRHKEKLPNYKRP